MILTYKPNIRDGNIEKKEKKTEYKARVSWRANVSKQKENFISVDQNDKTRCDVKTKETKEVLKKTIRN